MQGVGWTVLSRINRWSKGRKHLKKMCILLFYDGMSRIYLLNPKKKKRSRLTGEVRPPCLCGLPDLANKHRVNFEFEINSKTNFSSKMSPAIFKAY